MLSSQIGYSEAWLGKQLVTLRTSFIAFNYRHAEQQQN